MASVTHLLRRTGQALSGQTEPYSIAAFRIVFGLLLFWHTVSGLLSGSVYYSLTDTRFRFSYPLLSWLEPLPGRGMDLLWLGLALATLGIALGLMYRFSALLFAAGFSYSFFLDSANYTNADYLVVVLAWILVLAPAHRAWSLDNLWMKRKPSNVRYLWLFLLQAQFIFVYVGGGIAKINGDWLQGGPLTILLAERSDLPIFGQLFTLTYTGLLLSWFGLFFDLSVVFLVLWKRTQVLGFLMAVGFHTMNSQLFSIGYFPWLCLFGLTLYLSPLWPLQALQRAGLVKNAAELAPLNKEWTSAKTHLIVSLLALYVLAQVLVPLRHFAIGEDLVWDDNGNTFSWHMITAYKVGQVIFEVKTPEGEVLYRGPAYDLTVIQRSNLIGRPDAIRQYAKYLALSEQSKNNTSVLPEVYVYSPLSVNGRQEELLIDPKANMADRPGFFFTPDYVNNLDGALPSHKKILRDTLAELE